MKLANVLSVLDSWYPPSLAASWDASGLVCGDPSAEVSRVLFAVDPVRVVIDEAIDWHADLVVTHHPLLLRGVHGVPANDPKGAVVHRLIRHGSALLAKHTDADHARPGVSDAIAEALGCHVIAPLDPLPHDVSLGTGRLGELPKAMPLRDFASRVARVLPQTAHGVRVAGDPARMVRRIAVCGGAGDSLLDLAVLADVDVYLTSDLRHHRASEFLESGGCSLIDVAHWAAEWMWLASAAERLAKECGVTTRVSTVVTDPWDFRV